ncbi:hypothetical protein TNCV_4806761 [Trichonephila clavipes]|nr:hypothetical protein TNCV_4806761 [Trichonephila clavipes]
MRHENVSLRQAARISHFQTLDFTLPHISALSERRFPVVLCSSATGSFHKARQRSSSFLSSSSRKIRFRLDSAHLLTRKCLF